MKNVHNSIWGLFPMLMLCNSLVRCIIIHVQCMCIPISSSITKECFVAMERMLAVSDISTWNVDMCRATLSAAPMRAKRQSATPTTALWAGTKLPIWYRKREREKEEEEGRLIDGVFKIYDQIEWPEPWLTIKHSVEEMYSFLQMEDKQS